MGKNNVEDIALYRLRKEGLVMDNSYLEMTVNCNTNVDIKNYETHVLNLQFDNTEAFMKFHEYDCSFMGLLEPSLQMIFPNNVDHQKILFVRNVVGYNLIDIYDSIKGVFLGDIEVSEYVEDNYTTEIVLRVSGFARIKIKFINQTDLRNKIITTSIGLCSILTQRNDFMDTIRDVSLAISLNENLEINI